MEDVSCAHPVALAARAIALRVASLIFSRVVALTGLAPIIQGWQVRSPMHIM